MKTTSTKIKKHFGQAILLLATTLIVILSSGLSTLGDNSVSSGTTLRVSAGTTMVSVGTMTVKSGGVLNNQGTVILNANLDNQNAGNTDLGSGTYILNGTSLQTVNGTNTFGGLTVNNPGGATLNGNTAVNGMLTFTQGIIAIGVYNISLGSSATVAGSPSASSMVTATASGEFRKSFSGVGSFTFPVGDYVSTADYSPVTVNFTSGTFGGGNYVGVKLVNAAYPGASGNYLNRYWEISQSGITSFNCNVVFQYVPADVVGTESLISGVKVYPLPIVVYTLANTSLHQLTANGLTSFGIFTGGQPTLDKFVNLTCYIEGPYNSTLGTINTTLRTLGLVPLSQPYSAAPWTYTGTETVASVPAEVVDWVLVELRQATSPANATSATIFGKRAAFVKSNGAIVDLDGSSPLQFESIALNPGNNLYPVIRHRNHLAIMSSVGVTKDGGTGYYTYDFSTAVTKAYGGTNGYKQIGMSPLRYGMVTGDIDQDASIFVSDYNVWAAAFGVTNVYNKSDLDTDGNVFVTDYNKWAANFGLNNDLKSAKIQSKYFSCVPE